LLLGNEITKFDTVARRKKYPPPLQRAQPSRASLHRCNLRQRTIKKDPNNDRFIYKLDPRMADGSQKMAVSLCY